MSFVPRPNRDESEEDLLRQQEEFLRNKGVSAGHQQQKVDDKNDKHQNESTESQIELITDIMERNVLSDYDNYVPENVSCGFPVASRRKVINSAPREGKSIFAQQMSKKNNDVTMNEAVPLKTVKEGRITGIGLGTENWQQEMNFIKQENIEKIKTMTAEEVEVARKEIMKSLDPKVISFLQQKNINTKTPSEEVKPRQIELDMPLDTNLEFVEKALPFDTSEIKKNKWLNMEVVEKEKLAWVGDLPPPSVAKSSDSFQSARFDLKGNLVLGDNSIPTQSGLYHHGEDQHLPGYTLNELITFIQSSLPSQKVIGLQVLAKILEKVHQGIFDSSFNENILPQLLTETPIILLVRQSMDNNAETVWKDAVNCMHKILCNTIFDEMCLDRLFPLLTEIDSHLEPKIEGVEDISSLSDEQWAHLDAIRALVERTDILHRIRFLIDHNEKEMDVKTLNCIFDILIRIARRSHEMKMSIISTPYLVDSLLKNFVPCQVSFEDVKLYDRANSRVLKLFRLLLDNNVMYANQLLTTYPEFLNALKVYLTLNPENCATDREILQVSIEALRIWTVLLKINVASQDFISLYPVVIKQVQYCQTLNCVSRCNRFDWQYAAVLLRTVSIFASVSSGFSGFQDLIKITLFSWVSQIAYNEVLPNLDALIALSCAVNFALMANIPLVNYVAEPILNSPTLMRKLINSLGETSTLVSLNNYVSGQIRDASCLPSFGSIQGGGNLTNLLADNCPLFLLSSLSDILLLQFEENLATLLLLNENLQIFITNIIKHYRKVSMTCFELFEIEFIAKTGLLALRIRASLQKLTLFKNVNILFIHNMYRDIRKDVLTQVIFNQRSFLSLSDSSETPIVHDEYFASIVKKAIANLPSIHSIYLSTSKFNTYYWLFDPILHSFKTKVYIRENILGCFDFIGLILKCYYNYLRTMFSRANLFVLTASAYLVSSNLFLEDEFHFIASNILSEILKNGAIVCRPEAEIPYFVNVGDL